MDEETNQSSLLPPGEEAIQKLTQRLNYTAQDEEEVSDPAFGYVSTRIRRSTSYWVDEFAQRAGLSRTAMVEELVKVGMSVIRERLRPEVDREIADDVYEAMSRAEEH